MYDDLLGPKPEPKKELKNKINLVDDNAKPADPKKYPSHESVRNHDVVEGCDCGDCDDPCPTPTPKDPWKDVTPGPDDGFDDDGLSTSPGTTGWEDDPCDADCDNCDDEACKSIDDLFGDLDEIFEDDDEEDWDI